MRETERPLLTAPCPRSFMLEASPLPLYPFTLYPSPLRVASLLLTLYSRGMWNVMTRTRWMLLGAVALGIVIVVYFVLFCPEECH